MKLIARLLKPTEKAEAPALKLRGSLEHFWNHSPQRAGKRGVDHLLPFMN
jgi:hypothetical protein